MGSESDRRFMLLEQCRREFGVMLDAPAIYRIAIARHGHRLTDQDLIAEVKRHANQQHTADKAEDSPQGDKDYVLVSREADRIIAICDEWIAAGAGDECFWEGWPECPSQGAITPKDLKVVLSRRASEPNK